MTATTDDERADPLDDREENNEDAAESDVQGDEFDEEAQPAGRRPRFGNLAAAVACAILLAALVCSGALGWRLWQQRQLDEAARQAQQAAIDYAQTLTSIDSNHVDENFTRVLNGATGEFKDMYTKSSTQLRQLLIDNRAAAHGSVVDSAIQSKSKDKVVVLLMVDQTVSNAALPDGRVDRSRMKITMDKVDDRWLAGKVELP
ncbi:Mce protein [Mycobacterium sp. 48b]|uniref:Mce protein n=1 Tax=Mycobacterium sp. 48b TaxID=3400426 RepID=UPI003AAC7DCA